MNSKGYTLIEVLAVIVIIGIISTIGVLSFNSINKDLKTDAYDNLLILIEAKAIDYAVDYNISDRKIITIDELIEEGYLSADDGSEYLYNPLNKTEKLNCTNIYIEKELDNYKISLEVSSKSLQNEC